MAADKNCSSSQSRTRLTVRLLGEFRAGSGVTEIEPKAWRLKNAERLVKMLSLSSGYLLHREEIFEYLWPDLDVSAAANNLRYSVHAARRVLRSVVDIELLFRRRDHLVLADETDLVVDVVEFERLAERARVTEDRSDYWNAIEAYSGELLPEDRYEEWTIRRRETLRDQFHSLLFELSGIESRFGNSDDAMLLLQRLTTLDPGHEEAHVNLIRLLLNRGQRHRALRQYAALRDALRSELDIDPEPASQRLYRDILTGNIDSPVDVEPSEQPELRIPPTQPARIGNLPFPVTSFIGRTEEIAAVQRCFSSSRLVTLTGAGGSGKTRLAIETARQMQSDFPDGVWMIDAGTVTDPGLLESTIAVTLGIGEQSHRPVIGTLTEELADRSLLIILDNCEHVLPNCTRLAATLLSACPNLSILATSRERLHAGGEITWMVPPLPVPQPNEDISLSVLGRIESVQLFCERASLVQPSFELDDVNSGAVADICRRLDGVPLAIELAAARLSVLSPAQLSARLDDMLSILSDGDWTGLPRHRTIRATLDWSYRQLDTEEQALLRRLSVFTGGNSLEAAEFIFGSEDGAGHQVMRRLAALVDKSLITVDLRGGESRYRLLSIIRQYLHEKLVQASEWAEVNDRHAHYFLALAESIAPHLSGEDQHEWLDRLELELENLRAALTWLDETAPELALRLAASMGRYWWARSYFSEGRMWLSHLLTKVGNTGDRSIRARALIAMFLILYRQGDHEEARIACEEVLLLERQLGNQQGVATTLGYLAMAVGELGDLERSRELLEESLSLSERIGDQVSAARALNSLGEISRIQGDFRQAGNLYQRSLSLWREIGDRQYIAILLHNLGHNASLLGDASSAFDLLRESVSLETEIGNLDGIAAGLASLAMVNAQVGRYRKACRLFGAADAIHRQLGTPEDTADELELQRWIAITRSHLGERAFDDEWSNGMSLSSSSAVDEATRADPEISQISAAEIDVLSVRQQQVARLVGEGLTNSEIAQTLGMSRRTADTHVSQILRRLGFTSRTQIMELFRQSVENGG